MHLLISSHPSCLSAARNGNSSYASSPSQPRHFCHGRLTVKFKTSTGWPGPQVGSPPISRACRVLVSTRSQPPSQLLAARTAWEFSTIPSQQTWQSARPQVPTAVSQSPRLPRQPVNKFATHQHLSCPLSSRTTAPAHPPYLLLDDNPLHIGHVNGTAQSSC